jgi:cation diffusion facilitator CzcD-associated flavoprotein CzcO
MAHIDKVLNLRQDTFFNARVNDATWDDSVGKWTVTTVQGHKATAKYLISCTGLLHRTYTPEFEGLKDYKGELYHSGDWDESFSAKGKKVAIIGAGATAVQITQELGKDADELKVFVRRPSYCLPLQQREWSELEQTQWKSFYPALFQASRNSGTGFPCERQQVKLFDVDLETREKLFDRLWNAGGFHFLRANYTDVVIDKEANKVGRTCDSPQSAT